jgi:phosphatidate cytidylyltransferase
MYYYLYILIISLIIISIISWIEFYGLIFKIFKKNNYKEKIIKFIFKSFSLIYLIFFSSLIFVIVSKSSDYKILIIYALLVCICSDIGGLLFGKLLKGKKLSKISPNKTFSGLYGSFFFSLLLVPIFTKHLINYSFLSLFIITLLISLTSQIGDLFISFLKRKAKVKDTGNILPGHGGILDRIDGILLAVPISILLFNLF